MQKPWRWISCSLVGLGVLCLIFLIVVYIVMNRPHVTQSNGFTGVTPAATARTLSQSLPNTATQVRYCRGSIGMGGRMMMYRFSAPLADLHAHAKAEFAAHWDQPEMKSTPNVHSPFTEANVESIESQYGIDSSWMLSPVGATGTIYQAANGQRSHRPIIFIDETSGVLYFEMTD